MGEPRHLRQEAYLPLVEDTERDITAERVRLKMGETALESTLHFLGEADSPYEHVRDYIDSRVIDQPEAVEAIVVALEKSFVRKSNDNRPRAAIALLGPTGTGKTETARALSEVLGEDHDKTNLIKIDCSAYANGHEITNLLGSPPSYVGADVEPLFSAKNIEKPGTVVLFDEIEKGSPALHRLMLQIMDDGLVTLNKNKQTNFRDTVVLMTSNAGADSITKETSGHRFGLSSNEGREVNMKQVDSSAIESFKKRFSPEFVNRIDNLVPFHPLSEAALHQVLDVKLSALNEHYYEEYGTRINLSEATRHALVSQAANEPQFGARPLVRLLEQRVQSKFGRYIGAEYVGAGTEVLVYQRDELEAEDAASVKDDFVFAIRDNHEYVPEILTADAATVSSNELVHVPVFMQPASDSPQ